MDRDTGNYEELWGSRVNEGPNANPAWVSPAYREIMKIRRALVQISECFGGC